MLKVPLGCAAVIAWALFFSTPAYAADGGTASITWPILGAAAIQVVIAVIVGLFQASSGRLVRLTDERVEVVSKRVEALAAQLASTREDYARRADLDARMAGIERDLAEFSREVRGELKEVRTDNAKILKALDRVGA